MTDTHPMLREVLAALTDNMPTLRIFRSPMEVRLEAKRVGYHTPIGLTRDALRGSTLWHAWTTENVADAWERLIAREVLPQSFASDTRRFACGFCDGYGATRVGTSVVYVRCDDCHGHARRRICSRCPV